MTLSYTNIDTENIESVAYDKTTKKFHVRFKTGDLYIYYAVTEQSYVSFMSANDKEAYYLNEIKDQYEERRVS
ncbi:KTSC domain-containing protein [Alkalihalobacterium chitinilyticum]|uniref:KTSC domain-containing protein n=1 Tax=Alkalihalobacterium chitinilyticum TaxID=2980103 RepID=A0ABT5VKN7_9BACI|nr:KTSC domain-containing protein [Alkalihalobacterium chitinilyticum]MDE5414809.1 KTSC domain-containing protein [Alkalihalobacterium chitinilyticum]